VFWPLNVMMAQETGKSTFKKQSELFLKNWICAGNAANYTDRGRAFNPMSGSLGSTANAAMMSLIYGQMMAAEKPASARTYNCWGLSQVRYMMGDAGRSLVVGVGKKAPTRTQDRAAACPPKPQVRPSKPRASLPCGAAVPYGRPPPTAGPAPPVLAAAAVHACPPRKPAASSRPSSARPHFHPAAQVCNRVTGLLSPDPDTVELSGALVHGSGFNDDFSDTRTMDSAWVGMENNVGFTGEQARLGLEPGPGLGPGHGCPRERAERHCNCDCRRKLHC
jgi:hypothetical protein